MSDRERLFFFFGGYKKRKKTARRMSSSFFSKPARRTTLDPIYFLFPQVLSPVECRHLIHLAHQKGFHESTVITETQLDGQQPKSRKSKTCWIHYTTDTVIHRLYSWVESLTGYSKNELEDLQIVKYDPDGYFRQHFDQCEVDSSASCKDNTMERGHRVYTLLLYLNDGFEGGETTFLHYGHKVRGNIGDALIFPNVFFDEASETYQIEPRSLHEGNSVTSGTKYIANIWIRHRLSS